VRCKKVNEVLLQTNKLKKYFDSKGKKLHAVDGIDLTIKKGRTLGVVGESGCGKTTLGRTVLGLLQATYGEIIFDGQDVTDMGRKQFKELRKDMQIIFQDPYSSINPRHRVGRIIEEPLLVNGIVQNKKERKQRTIEIMKKVGLSEKLYNTYPHELDGGRRQRVGIARALSVDPKFIVCDEPVSALDVSIQAQVLNLLMDLQEEMGLTYMFITHDMSVVKHISDEIMVMYKGQCVERAFPETLFSAPKHPYTKALLSAIPIPSADAKKMKPQIIKGEITSPIDPKPGCRFANRCPLVKEECKIEDLPLKEVEPGHFVSCTLYNK
jgi:oligopeptide/dipeptide ABC transporter ATP-binding protein